MTRVGKSARYALYAAMELARGGEGGQVTAAEVSARFSIPPAVMAKVFQQMVRAGLATGIRGSRGGYRLVRHPSEVTVLDVLDAFERRRAPGSCLLDGERPERCGHDAACRLRRLFDEVDELARCTFASISLETLVGRTGMAASGALVAAPGDPARLS
jgi:Rrf2 family protein